MIVIYILTLLAFLFVSWILLDRHFENKRLEKKLKAQEKRKKSRSQVGVSKQNRTKKANIVVGPATALAGAAMVHHLTKNKHLDEGSSHDVVYDLGDDELDEMYMMNEEEAMDCYDGVQQYDDDASYDDYMASLDDDY